MYYKLFGTHTFTYLLSCGCALKLNDDDDDDTSKPLTHITLFIMELW